MFVDWTLMLFILVSAFIYTSAYVDPANLTGKQTLLITILCPTGTISLQRII